VRVGAVQGSLLGLEIDVSTSGSVSDTLGRFEECRRHFWVLRGVLSTLLGTLARRLFSRPCATPRVDRSRRSGVQSDLGGLERDISTQ